MPLRRFEVWDTPTCDLMCGEGVNRHLTSDVPGATLEYVIEAATWEEACAIWNLRRGHEPYRPDGAAEPCPKCGALHYPFGSGMCWSCDHVG